MELIETIELTSSQSSITFSSIPQTYDDLVLMVSARTDKTGTGAVDQIDIQPNNSTSNRSRISLFGTGSTVGSSSGTTVRGPNTTAFSSPANTFGNGSCHISNYTSSQPKSFSNDTVNERDTTETAVQAIEASLWDDTSAITSLVLVSAAAANFVSGSTFSLYGISAS